jgi:sugar phosphate isomerase/epimerase
MTWNRREFLAGGALVAAGAVLRTDAAGLFGGAAAPAWPIGCYNRPWSRWPFEETLKAVKAAGYGVTGLLTRSRTDPFISADATPEYLDGLNRAIAASGVSVNMAALSSRHNIPLEETVASLRKQLDHAALRG